ncbi:MAG: hypothetical protein HQK72_09425 [Desulfamplus sp.]|nr:hypothetical protein [Desulfamplus sp.]
MKNIVEQFKPTAESLGLWENGWIASRDLKKALNTSKINVKPVSDADEVIQPEEIDLFKQKASAY